MPARKKKPTKPPKRTKRTIVPRWRYPLLLGIIAVFLVTTTAGLAYIIIRDWNTRVVVSVVDGDSMQLSDGRRVRLLGVDAPELGACMGDYAHRRLAGKAMGKHVRLKNIVRDDYGRYLANVIIEEPADWFRYLYWRLGLTLGTLSGGRIAFRPVDPDPFLNRMMVREGYARYTYVTSPYSNILKTSQTFAKENNLGIWSGSCRCNSPLQPGCDIKGNNRNGDKVYHTPDCPNYDDVIIDTSFGDSWFCSESDATAAGFRKAEGCM